MKKIVFIFLISVSVLSAQENKHEQIRALKTAYITEKLNFSSSDAEKFWPVYNEYEQKFHEIRKQQRNEVYLKLKNNWESLSDAEAKQLMDRYLELKFDDLQLLKERTEALRNVITSKKIITLNKVEEDFKRELLDRYRKNHSEK